MARLTPIKAIRQKCIECCGYQMYEVRKCQIEDCALWEYRMGHRPRMPDAESSEIREENESNEEVTAQSIQDREKPSRDGSNEQIMKDNEVII